MRVLIVDDKEENVYYLKSLLTGHGYQIDTAENGAEALALARSRPPDLVISDLLMPTMDGYTLLRHWKGSPELKHVPFIVYTATYTESEDEELARRLGADAFILKPTEPDAFMHRVKAVLDERSRLQDPMARDPLGKESELLELYNETLIRKLEQKRFELEQANRELQKDIETRVQVEESLRVSESRYRAIVESEPECVKVVSREGFLLDMNPAGLRMVEADPDQEIVGAEVLNWIHPQDQAAYRELHTRALRGEPGQLQFRLRGLKGTERWMDTYSTPLRDADGSVNSVLSVTRDITEQRHSQEVILRVAQSVSMPIGEEFLRQLTEMMVEALGVSGGMIALLNSKNPRVVHTNTFILDGRQMEAICYEVDGTPCERVVQGQCDVFEKNIQQLFPTDRVLKEYKLQAYAGAPMVTPRGEVIGLVAVFDRAELKYRELVLSALRIFASRTVSELNRLAADHDLRESEERFRNLLQNVPNVAIQGFLEDGTILYWNRASEKFYGYTQEEALGRNLLDLIVPPDARPDFELALRTACETGREIPHGELTLVRKDGSRITVYSSHAVVQREGHPVEMFCIDVDLSERKRLEKQFLRAQRMESIGTLAGGIAHDLNNVLLPILVSIELFRIDEKSPERLQLLRNIENSARHGAALVQQVLSFARGIDGNHTVMQLGPLVEKVFQIVEDTFPKNIELKLGIPNDLWAVKADATQIHQVLMNLCVNARDAMPDGGRLALRLENRVVDEMYAGMNPEFSAGNYVVILVEDSGVGISSEDQNRIFDPFFTTKEPGKGTGLGLATVATILRGHKGFVTLNSESGLGSRFEVFLPAAVDGIPSGTSHVESPDSTSLPRGNGELVLVVDDEFGIREITRRTLERFGYRVLLAANGAEAIALYAQQGRRVALVLTDMAMPVMDGPATVVALRNMDPLVKIIGSSGHSSNGGTAQAIGAGLQHFIAKPYTAETLLRTIAGALSESSAKGA